MGKFIENHLEQIIQKESDFNGLYNFIKQNPFISSYRNGKKYFFLRPPD